MQSFNVFGIEHDEDFRTKIEINSLPDMNAAKKTLQITTSH